ncbi:hypothetical protein BHE90_012954 [Fusarium euwallaceae]|uniref:CCHC-type domain-containing protein n=1 Tax=Fusarium euwallaceae TaxID=1147111 RepID=A0A430LAC3_9HYPO|nr:hypothetical protein BHE90_012954 [Fusarium euwallaceae]
MASVPQAYGPSASTHDHSPAAEASSGSGYGQQAQDSRGQGKGLKVAIELGVKVQPSDELGQIEVSFNARKGGQPPESIVPKVPFVSHARAEVAQRAVDQIAAYSEDTDVNFLVWPQPRKRKIKRESKLTLSDLAGLWGRQTAGPEADVPEVGTEMVDGADAEDIEKCPSCSKEGHTIRECMLPRRDGYVHGCIHCNTADHQTGECTKHPRDTEKLVDLLVKSRPNMPPLKATPWYPALYEYMEEKSLENVEHFPWRPQFGIHVIQDGLLSAQALESMEKGVDFRPRDPEMTDWVAIKDRHGKPKIDVEFPRLGTEPQGDEGRARNWSQPEERQPVISQKRRKI